MIKIKDILAIVAVAVMAGGCNSRDEVQPEELVPIRLAVAIDGNGTAEGRTRAATDPTTANIQNSDFREGQEVSLFIKEKNGDWIAQPSTSTVSSAGYLDNIGYNYPMDATPVVIYGVHPSSSSISSSFTVRTDQTLADDYAFSDLCYSKTKEYARSADRHDMLFKHLLSKIVISVDATGAGGGAVTNLKLRAMTSIPFTYPADNDNGYTLGPTATTPGTITMNNPDNEITEVAAIIPPQATSASNIVRITFDLAGVGPIVYEFPAGEDFLSGKAYHYTVKVGSSITVTSTITDWGTTTSTNKTVEIGRPKLPIEYVVGTHNMKTATTMAEDDDVENSAYFYWGTNASTPTENIKRFINGTALSGYHLPSKLEWCSIIPPQSGADLDPDIGGASGTRLEFRQAILNYNLSERIAWGVTNNNTSSTWSVNNYSYEVDRVFYNDYNCPNDPQHYYIGYALRFKDKIGDNYVNGRYTCAFRYEYIPDDSSVGSAALLIKIKYVGANAGITVLTLNDEEEYGFWHSPDYTLKIPACRLVGLDSQDHPAGSYSTDLPYPGIAYYWTASPDGTNCFHMCFNSNRLYGNRSFQYGFSISVRLFKDAE